MLTHEDLAGYRPIEREPARVTYRGREVLTNPPPSSGGILIADASASSNGWTGPTTPS